MHWCGRMRNEAASEKLRKTRSNPAHRSTENLGWALIPWRAHPEAYIMVIPLYNKCRIHALHVALFPWQQRVTLHLWLLVWIVKNVLLQQLRLAWTENIRRCRHRYLDAYRGLRKCKGHCSFCTLSWQNNLPLPSKNTRLALSWARLLSLIVWDFEMQGVN